MGALDGVQMTDWQLRDAHAGDIEGVANLWLEGYFRSHYGRQFQFDGGRAVYESRHRPRVEAAIARATTRIICDPEAPGVIWAFAVTEPCVVHWVMAKRRIHRTETSADMFRDLLGPMLRERCVMTSELVEFRRLEVVKQGLRLPEQWILDEHALTEQAERAA